MASPLCRQPKRVTWIMKPFIHSCMHAYIRSSLASLSGATILSVLSLLGKQLYSCCFFIHPSIHSFIHSFIRFFHSKIHSDSYLSFSPLSFSCNTISYHLPIPSSWNDCIFFQLWKELCHWFHWLCTIIDFIDYAQSSLYTETAAIHLVYRSKTKFHSNSNSIGL